MVRGVEPGLMGRHRTWLLVAVLVCCLVPAVQADGGSIVPPGVATAAGLCDPIDTAACLLPYPNDFFTIASPTTASGRRLNLSALAMPTNVAGKPIDPTEWNRQDGFSPGSPIMTRVPGLDLRRTWGFGADQITDLSRSLQPDAPIILLDATTGERHPFWSELDSHPGTTEAQRLLIIRPATNMAEGHRYVVALRRMRSADGSELVPGSAFRKLRDGTAGVTDLALAARRPAMERVFSDLAAAGISRGSLYLAWDFTVATERNLTERVLTMRDDAFARLGDTDLADGVIAGAAPRFTVTSVTDMTADESRATSRTIKGTIEVPNYLTPQQTVLLESPDALRKALEDLNLSRDLPSPLADAVNILTDESAPIALPGSRINYGADDLPQQSSVQPTVDVPFDCHLPRRENVPNADGRADGLLYGHGLLGDRGEASGSSTEDLRLRGFAVCAVDWWGMSFADLTNVVVILLDVSNFASLADRAQQGFVNWLVLGRALAHPDGFASHPAFQADGEPLIRTGGVLYDGNSQGAIMGGALTALAPDFTRAKLGVPGMNYSTLLHRSVDWEGQYAVIMYTMYPSKIDQLLVMALIQSLWDRAEANGYAAHMTSDPLPGTPSHQVMLQVAYADHQVANVAAEVEGRTIGARMSWPALGPDSPHWSVDPMFGFAPADFGAASAGQSVLVYWYSADRGNTVPPNGNVPSASGGDPHGDPRKDNAGSDQVAHWFRTGELLDVCSGPCVTTEATRAN
jgi:hypothetical protein